MCKFTYYCVVAIPKIFLDYKLMIIWPFIFLYGWRLKKYIKTKSEDRRDEEKTANMALLLNRILGYVKRNFVINLLPSNCTCPGLLCIRCQRIFTTINVHVVNGKTFRTTYISPMSNKKIEIVLQKWKNNKNIKIYNTKAQRTIKKCSSIN